MFNPLHASTTTDYTFSVRWFDGERIAYVSVKQRHYGCRQIIEQTERMTTRNHIISRTHRDSTWSLCLAGEDLKQRISLYGKDPSWLIDLWQYDTDKTIVLTALTPERYQAYFEDNKDFGREPEADKEANVLATLEAGNFHLIVRPVSGGVYYGVDNRPILRRFFFDYINTGVDRQDYHVEAVYEHLKSHPEVAKVEIKNIPSYNAKVHNDKGIEFVYSPADLDAFMSLIEKDDTFGRMGYLRERLGIEKFKREKPLPYDPEED
jgi:hypothetical protein